MTPDPGAAPGAFAGKSVLVTGGSRGIGKVIALRFAELGAARVAVGYMRSDRAAEETADELSALGAEPLLLRGNVGDAERAEALLAEAGPVDILVANAATGVIRPTHGARGEALGLDAERERALGLHARTACRTDDASGSSIVALSSLGAGRVLDGYVLVGVSKAAIEALVRYLAVELAPRDIRVNAVSAGLVETGALDAFPNREEMLAYYRSRTPVGRLVEPVDIADAVCFLASPQAAMIRGQTIVVDGGYSLLA